MDYKDDDTFKEFKMHVNIKRKQQQNLDNSQQCFCHKLSLPERQKVWTQ